MALYLKSMANGPKTLAPVKAASAVISLYKKTNSLRPRAHTIPGGLHRAQRCNAEVWP